MIICDIDGTLSDDTHRQALAQAKKWDEYHAAAVNDTPHKDVLTLLRIVGATANIPICLLTGRTDDYRPLTIKWLADHRVPCHYLLMRPSGDFRPANVVKQALVELEFGGIERAKENTLFMLDNDERGVTHWRGLGFQVWQVR